MTQYLCTHPLAFIALMAACALSFAGAVVLIVLGALGRDGWDRTEQYRRGRERLWERGGA